MINKKRLINTINNIDINKELSLTEFEHKYIASIKFTQEPIRDNDWENLNGKYSWVAKSTYHRYIFPLRNSNYVSFFKTLQGAKRNFIRTHIKDQNQERK